MMKKLILLMALFAISTGIYAQEEQEKEVPKKFNTYNYRRALECIDEYEYTKAMEFLETEVKENPKNGYAYNLLSLVKYVDDETDEALEAINKAIKLIPKKDTEKMAECYDIRSHIYLEMEDTLKALDDLASAIKLKPKDTELEDLTYEKADDAVPGAADNDLHAERPG